MSEWSRFQSQFYETDWERQERWRNQRAKCKAEGKCWQCAKPIAECVCPNINHNAPPEGR
jgi:hypothetical protein